MNDIPSTFPRAAAKALKQADRDTCPTHKVRYRTRLKALRVLEAYRQREANSRHLYYCSSCDGWHLTSQESSDHPRSALTPHPIIPQTVAQAQMRDALVARRNPPSDHEEIARRGTLRLLRVPSGLMLAQDHTHIRITPDELAWLQALAVDDRAKTPA